jgi:hypothetical protein
MLKPADEPILPLIPKEELVGAAKAFLINSDPNSHLVALENINSFDYGSSDLLLVDKAKANLTAVKLRCPEGQESSEKFVISSLCYYFWLREAITIGEVLLKVKTELQMFLFSHDFSSAIFYLVDNMVREFPIHVVRYSVCRSEDLDEPEIHFHDVTFRETAQKGPQERNLEKRGTLIEVRRKSIPTAISPQELGEFCRLRERYLG